MADIANVGFAADTSELERSKSALQGMVAPAKAAESSASKLSATLTKLDAAADKLNAAASGLASASERLVIGLSKEASAAASAAAGLDRQTAATSKATAATVGMNSAVSAAAAGIEREGRAAAAGSVNLNNFAVAVSEAARAQRVLNASAAAGVNALGNALDAAIRYTNQLPQANAHMNVYNAHLLDMKGKSDLAAQGVRNLGTAVQAAALQHAKNTKAMTMSNLNLSRQFMDIGVTAAMGMNPLLIAIQQGPQILDGFQTQAMMTGRTVKQSMADTAASVARGFMRIAPLIAKIGLVTGTMAAAWGLAIRNVNKDLTDNIDHLKLTEEQLNRLEDQSINTAVTIGDSFKGLGRTIKQYFLDAFGDEIDAIGKKWNEFLDLVTKNTANDVKVIVGFFTGMYGALEALWKNLPAMMRDAFVTGANAVIVAAETMGNAIIRAMNPIAALTGVVPRLTLGRLDNQDRGAITSAEAAIAAGFSSGQTRGREAVGSFMGEFGERWATNNRAVRDERVLDAAGRARKPPKGGRTDAEKFSSIVDGATNDIATLRAQRQAIGLTAEAAAELEQRQKLLNQANRANITLTPEMTRQIDELAAAYGRERQALINSKFAYDTRLEVEREIAALNDQTQQIGLVGKELAYQTKLTELLTAAEAEQVTITRDLRLELEGLARAYSEASGSNAAAGFYDEMLRGAQETRVAAVIERATIGMTADAAARYRYEKELLNDARRRGISLTPDEVARLVTLNSEYVAITEEIRLMNEAMSFTKETTRGFFDDMMQGLRDGANVWDTFGNAVVNVLDRIADKLTEVWTDELFSSNSVAGGGGLFGKLLKGFGSIFGGPTSPGGDLDGLFAKGAAFDGSHIDRFAKGGAFTNAIVSRPTLFSFANGTALGEMGEAGPEAIMPLARGPDGSLGVQLHGGAGSGNTSADSTQKVDVGVRVYPTKELYAEIETIARDEAVSVTSVGIEQYDQALPSRVNQIANDDRVR